MSSPRTPIVGAHSAAKQNAKTHSHGKWLLNYENGKRVKIYESPVPVIDAVNQTLPEVPLDDAGASCSVDSAVLADVIGHCIKQERNTPKSKTQEALPVVSSGKDPTQNISIESEHLTKKPAKRSSEKRSTDKTTLRRSARVRGKT